MRHLNAPLSAGRDTLAVCPLWKADMLLLNALITTTNWRRGRYFVKFPKTSPSGLFVIFGLRGAARRIVVTT